MRASDLEVMRDRPPDRSARSCGCSEAKPGAPRSGPVPIALRCLLVALPLALAGGGCTMVQADSIDRVATGPLSPLETSGLRTPAIAPDDAAWRLRLTRL